MVQVGFDEFDMPRLSSLCTRLATLTDTMLIAKRQIRVHSIFPALVSAGWQSGRHHHPFCEAHLVLRGTAAYHRPQGEETIVPGGFIIHRPREFHAWHAQTEMLRLGIWFSAEPALDLRVPDAWPVFPACLRDCAALFYEAEQWQPGWEERAQAYLTALLSRLLCAEYAQQAPVADAPHDEVLLVTGVEQILQRHIERDVRLGEIAGELGISTRHLTRLFAKQTGETIGQRHYTLRMNHAAALLSYTDLPLQVIGERIGITDAAYFTRRFRQYFHENPTSYRRRTKLADGPERK